MTGRLTQSCIYTSRGNEAWSRYSLNIWFFNSGAPDARTRSGREKRVDANLITEFVGRSVNYRISQIGHIWVTVRLANVIVAKTRTVLTHAETDAGLIESLVSWWLDGCFGGVVAFKTDAGPIGSYDLMAWWMFWLLSKLCRAYWVLVSRWLDGCFDFLQNWCRAY